MVFNLMNIYIKKLHMNNLIKEIYRIKSMMSLNEVDLTRVEKRSNYIFGSVTPSWGGGPNSHSNRHPDPNGDDWESCNAYDIMAREGTPVYSIVNGIVTNVKKRPPGLTGTKGKRVYGDSVTIKGVNGDPQTFYTHMADIVVNKNYDIKKGDLIGFVAKGEQGIPSHIHVGVDYGYDIKKYVELDGKIKSLPDIVSKPTTDNKSDTLIDKLEDVGDKLKKDVPLIGLTSAGISSLGLSRYKTDLQAIANRLGIVDSDVNMDSVSGVLNKIILSSEGIGTDEAGIHDAIKKLKNCSDLEQLNQMVSKSPIDGVNYRDIYDYINSEMDYGDDYFIKSLVETINNFCPGSVINKGNNIVKLNKFDVINSNVEKISAQKLILDLKSKGVTDAAAKALTANAYGESGFNVKGYGDGGSYAERPENSKRAAVINGKKYCSFGLWGFNICGGGGLLLLRKNGVDVDTASDDVKLNTVFNYNKQLDYISEKIKQEQIRGEKDVVSWINWIVDNIERPADKYGAKNKRIEYARTQKWI